MDNNQEAHVCVYCGQEAHFQFKNGKWCCKPKACQCQAFKSKISEGLVNWHKTNEHKEDPYPNRGDRICVYCGEYAEFQLKSGKWCCHKTTSGCPVIRNKNANGLKRAHERGSYDNLYSNGKEAWNKGKTAKDDPRIANGGKTLHKKYLNGELIPTFLGKKHTEETKRKLSESMKKAHAEGRAYILGTKERLGNPSRPEQWMINVIANEFEDKNYQREYRIFNYCLDFAWPHKKKYIEMDGAQHKQAKNKARDIERDRKICAEGWEVLRMPWDEVYKEPKLWIQKAKDFIDSTNLNEL